METPRILLDRRLWLLGDALLVGALLTSSLVEILLTKEHSGGWIGPDWALSSLAVLSIVPLLARRRWPIAVVTVVVVSTAAIAGFAAPEQAAFEPFVALVIAVYAVGAHAGGRRGIAGLGIFLGVGLVTGIAGLLTDNVRSGDFIPILVWVGAAWVIGRIIRGRHLRTLELEELAAQLAREREEKARLAVANERARIARELHDVIAHNVSVMVIQAGAAGRVLEGEQPLVKGALQTIEDTGRQTVDEMRSLLGVLRRRDEDEPLAPQPSLRHLDALVE